MAKANYHIRRKCPICGTIFEIRTIDAVYCSHNCSAVASKRKKAQEEKEKKYEQMAKEIPDIKEYLTAAEAIAMYCVERSTLYRDIRLKKLPSVNLGQRQLRLKRSDLDERYELRKKGLFPRHTISNPRIAIPSVKSQRSSEFMIHPYGPTSASSLSLPDR